MRPAIVIDADDIKKMLAEKYGVPEKDVIKAQYSYTVILPEKDGETKDGALWRANTHLTR